MDLQAYIQSQKGNATNLAAALEISLSYLSQMAYGERSVSPRNAVAIEAATGGAVTRRELRPDDWHLIWPELKGSGRTKKAQGVI